MRDNENRTGISDRNTGAEDVIQNTQTQSSPLSFVSPTEFVELPSHGRFYSSDHPLHNAEVIEIKHMTTKEEDILTSQALLKNGKALERFIKEIIIDKRIDPDTLLIGDKNAILIEARISGYGSSYETKVACPSCQASVEHEFDLSDATVINTTDELIEENNVTKTDNGTYIINTLPATGWSVEVKPLNGKDEKSLTASLEARRKRKLPEDTLTTQMNMFIVSISGITDREQIRNAISNMPAKDSRQLRTTYQNIMPNVDMTQTFSCSECGHSSDMEVPFTTDFFWPKQ